MQQEIEQSGSSSPSSPSQPTVSILAQGDALTQLAALENHLAVLRQELVARDTPASVDSNEDGRSAVEKPSEVAETNLQTRDDDLRIREDDLNRRIAELDLREELLNRRDEELRRREEAQSTESDLLQTPETMTVSPAVTNELVPEKSSPSEVKGEAQDDEAPDYSNYLENLLRKKKNEPTTEESKSAELAEKVTEKAIMQSAKPEAVASPASDSNSDTPQKPKTGSPVDLAAILRKQGFSVEEDESPTDVPAKNAMREPKKPGKKPAVNEHPNTAPAGQMIVEPAEAKSGGEEESIDDYMSKLMARVRGGDAPGAPPVAAGPGQSAGPTPSAKKASQKAAAIAATKAAKAAFAPEPAPMIVQGELAPRTIAPEKNININAIRELANMSATSALNSHQQKKTAVNSQAKLLVTLVSLALGVALVVVSRLPHSSPYALYWGLAAFGVSAIWGVQFAKLFSQQLVERAARLDRHLKRTNEVASDPAVQDTEAKSASS